MSEQSPERLALKEDREVEGHKAALNEDPSAFAEAEENEGPEVEGHVKALNPEDPAFKG